MKKPSYEEWVGWVTCTKYACGCKFYLATPVRYPICPSCKRSGGLILITEETFEERKRGREKHPNSTGENTYRKKGC